ncbi:MAG: hypothetical protein NC218_11085 [Acetobacter sp.]|nr:hypothetical protein [Acetobacter sp.]
MSKFDKPEGQTTSDNFLASEIEKDFLRAQSGWGQLDAEDSNYLDKKGFKTPAELLKSYRALERGFSSRVALPKDGDKEAFDKLYSRLGMPQDADGFDIDFAEEDKDYGEGFKQACLQNNILPQAAKGLYDWFVKNRGEMADKSQKEWAENSAREMNELQAEWGAAAPRNLELVRRGVRLFSGDDDKAVADMEEALGTRRMMEVFCRLGEAVSEDNPVSFGRGAKTNQAFDAVAYFKEMFNDY